MPHPAKFTRLLKEGQALAAHGKFAEAAAKLQAALALVPRDAKALDLLGLALWQSGRKTEAEAAFRKAIAVAPEVAGYQVDLARTLLDLGQAEAAAEVAGRALELDPNLWEPRLLIGNVCVGRREFAQAIAHYQAALQQRPDYADAHVNLGAVQLQTKNLEAAVVECRKALELKPDHPDALSNLGAALAQLGRLDEAETALERVVARHPKFVGALSNLGFLRTRQHRFVAAIELYRRALALAPDFADARQNLGNSLLECCRIDEAMTHLRAAMSLQPGDDKPWQLLLYAANYHPDWNAEQILAEYQRWAASQAPAVDVAAFANPPEPDRRLRIGYVSPDFRGHACVYFIEPLLAAHDVGQFEIFAYSDTDRPDAITRRLRPQVAHWRDTVRLNDQELHALIAADGIDILVDLAGHTSGNRMLVFARRAAPIQMTWLGYGHTTGLASVDYFLTDPWLLPQGSENAIVETPWRLPRIAYTYRPPGNTPLPGPLPARANGHVTFGSLTRTVRLNEHVIAAWARILDAVPGSRLRLDQLPFEEAAFRAMFLERFARHGIAAERLDLTCTRPHWNAYQAIDIALDPFPHNAGTTTLDAFWMGVPVVSLAARPPLGHFGVALLHAVELDDWVADDVDAYVARAVAAAADLAALADLRQNLRLRLQASPLLDEAGFARTLEAGYRAMWQKWCAGHAERQERVVVSRMLQAAIKRHQAGNLAEAAELYRLILQLQPAQGDALNLLGVINQQQGDYAEAEALGRRAVAAMPDFAAGHGNLGSALAAQGRQEEAAAAFRRAIELDPGYVEAHFNLANTLLALQQWDAALAELRATVAVSPDHFRAWLALGKLLLERRQHEAAEAAIRKVCDLQPLGACRTLGSDSEERPQRAQFLPDSPPHSRTMGQESGEKWSAAVASQPEIPKSDRLLEVEARHVLAAILFETGRRDAARAEMEQAMQLRPEFAALLQQDWNHWCATLKEDER